MYKERANPQGLFEIFSSYPELGQVERKLFRILKIFFIEKNENKIEINKVHMRLYRLRTLRINSYVYGSFEDKDRKWNTHFQARYTYLNPRSDPHIIFSFLNYYYYTFIYFNHF